jgi:golgi phosphoprotein 3
VPETLQTLAEELLLLAHDIRGKCRIAPAAMDCGVIGALLSELAMTGRVTLDEGVVVTTDAPPTGDAVLDEVLGEIAATRRTPAEWVSHLRGARLTDRLLARMVDTGQVEVDHHRNYGLFAEDWYPVRDIVSLWEAHQRVVDAATANVTPDRRTLSLAAVAAAAGLAKVLLATSGDWKVLGARIREKSTGDWAATAVRTTLTERRDATV